MDSSISCAGAAATRPPGRRITIALHYTAYLYELIILLPKRALVVMLLLVQDIAINPADLGIGNGKGGIAGLPGKFRGYQVILIDEMRDAALDLLDYPGNRSFPVQ